MRLVLGVAAPLLLPALLEFALLLSGYGYKSSYFIPGPQPETVVSNPRFAWRFFTRQVSRAPLPIVCNRAKDPAIYRIVILGGSAALGDPDASVSFARILQAMLTQRFPGLRFEVLNTAMTAINSNVVRPIARDCAAYAPDLCIVYMGNNEVIGPYGIGTPLGKLGDALPLIHAAVRVRATRTGQLIESLAAARRDPLAASTNRWQGMQMFLAQKAADDDPRLEQVYDRCAANLDDICTAAREAGAATILCTVLTNLKDCPPFHSEHRPLLTSDELMRWNDAYARGEREQQAGDPRAAIGAYVQAAAIDDRFALLPYRIGQCQLALDNPGEARRWFERARDLDMFRFRADSRINDLIRAAAGHWTTRGVTLVDIARDLAATDRIPGAESLYDHVHMNFDGNYAIASLLFARVAPIIATARDASLPGNPPSREECAQWLLFSAFSEFEAAKSMSARMSAPPFAPEQGRRAMEDMQRKLGALSKPLLADIANQFRTVLGSRPDDLLLRANYAKVLYVMEDNAAATQQYRLLLSQYPYASDWQYFLGDALAALRQYDEAEAWLRKALALEPTNSETHRCLGLLLLNTGRPDEALREYLQAIALDPASVRARFELGQILIKRGDLRAAEVQLGEAVRLSPGQPEPLLYLGMALAAQNKIQDALERFRNAERLQPDSAPIQYNLAMAYYRLGKIEPAHTHYDRATALDPAYARPPYPLGSLLKPHRTTVPQ